MNSFQADFFGAILGGLWRGVVIGLVAFLPMLVLFTLIAWGGRP
jgi:hypothetical protein